jgi:2-polyprenyl-3-methyl-5-hydroxy-6-metoxy-1,4-benzoquinol methylase
MAPNPDHGPPADDDRLAAFALHVWRYKQGEVVSLMIHLGERLGLYRAMAGQGRITAAGLAARTQLHERWLHEWLRCQAAAGLVDTTDGEVFELSREGAEVLADEEGSLWFAAGAFLGGIAPPEVVDRVADAFRTGRGLSFDDRGPPGAHDAERTLAPWTRHALVQRVLPALDGVWARLEAGARVADVGCGAGVALVAMATTFPNSSFEGFDPSQLAVDLARARISETGLTNVTLHLGPATDLPARPTYDLVLTLDCIHDMPNPAEAMVAISRAIRPDGTWLIKDIRAAATWSDNQRNPMLAMMYGMSVVACLSSGLSEPGGAGLGTLGFHPQLAEAMCREAGFTGFVVLDFDDPSNLYYEVRL